MGGVCFSFKKSSSLDKCNSYNTPFLGFHNLILKGKCISVYDGDTVNLVLPFRGKYYKQRCRLQGIDCAEIRTKNFEEKKLGLIARDWLTRRIFNKKIWIKCSEYDKYGRLLVTLYLDKKHWLRKESINDLMVEKQLAYVYDGKSKKSFTHFLINRAISKRTLT